MTLLGVVGTAGATHADTAEIRFTRIARDATHGRRRLMADYVGREDEASGKATGSRSLIAFIVLSERNLCSTLTW